LVRQLEAAYWIKNQQREGEREERREAKREKKNKR
jgi:hypothetical protein